MSRTRPNARSSSSSAPSRLLGALAVVVLMASGCGPEAPGAKTADSRPLPKYFGHTTELFDDTIEAGAVGLEREATISPRADARLRERTKQADAVLRVRVETVTAKQEDSGTRWEVDFHAVDKLAGLHVPDDPFHVTITRASPSAGVLKAFEGRLVGKTFIAFVRMFTRDDGGDPELHFHLAPDTKEVLAAVSEARDLAAVN